MTDFYAMSPDDQADKLESLARSALSHWGLSENANLRMIKHRENAVFEATDTEHAWRYALRVHRAGYHSDDALRSELQWMRALDDNGIATPGILPTSDGDLFTVVSSAGVPEPRQVDIFQWVDGQPLGGIEDEEPNLEHLIPAFRTIGEKAARLHAFSEEWELPAGFTRHAWDIDGILGSDPVWGDGTALSFLTAEQKEILAAAKTKLTADLVAFGKDRDRYGVIHADLLPENFLVDGSELRLIDFDDSGFGWYLFDLATALFFHVGSEGFEPLKEALHDGYTSVRRMPDEHWNMLSALIVARGFTYLGWAHTRRETATAQELGPIVADMVSGLAEAYTAGQ